MNRQTVVGLVCILMATLFSCGWGVDLALVRSLSASTCMVDVADGSGSGVVVSSRPFRVLTCEHVIEHHRTATITFGTDGGFPVRVERSDAGVDLALLTCDKPPAVSPVLLAPSDPEPGSEVFAWGAPLGIPHYAMFGHVSDTPRDMGPDGTQLLLDMAVVPGMSGAGLCNARGELVGLIEAHLRETNIGFAVSLSTIKAFLADKP